MEYAPSAREVLAALREVRDADGAIWWHRAALAIADLYPFSAIAFALHQPAVWAVERRMQLRRSPPTAGGMGITFEDLVRGAEESAAAEGSRVVTEVHLAGAMAPHRNALLELGVFIEPLIEITSERAGQTPGAAVSKRPRISGAAREPLLDSALVGFGLDQLLDEDERSGRVERKLTVLNSGTGREQAIVDQVDAAVALVNGNPEAPCFLIFGQADDHTVVGQVDHQRNPIDETNVRKCQERVVNRLQRCDPPVIVKWRSVVREGDIAWIACLFGRERGTAVQTPHGSFPIRSGESTYLASQATVLAIARESVATAGQASAEERADPPLPAAGGSAAQRRGVAELKTNVSAFFAAPPDLPQQVSEASKLESWQLVYEPIILHFGANIEQLVRLGISTEEEGLARLGRGLRNAFSLRGQPRNGTSWMTEAPRLVCRLIADQIMAEAYVTQRWARIEAVGGPLFDSHIGRVPWVVAPEYRHVESLGQNARIAEALSAAETLKHLEWFRGSGIDETNLRAALSALNLGLGLSFMAREERNGMNVDPAWVTPTDGLSAEIEAWEEEPGVVEAFALLGGEFPENFASQFPHRLRAILMAVRGTGLFRFVSDAAIAAADRIGAAGAHAAAERAMKSEIL